MNEENAPRVDPVVATLSERAKDTPVVELQGVVGPTGKKDTVRLYRSRQMNSYIDIPKDKILHFIDPEKEDEPTRIYVPRSAQLQISFVTTIRADQSPFGRSGRGASVGQVGFNPLGCWARCMLEYYDCVERGESPEQCEAILKICWALCSG